MSDPRDTAVPYDGPYDPHNDPVIEAWKAANDAAMLEHRREQTRRRPSTEVWAAAHQLIRDADLNVGLRLAKGEGPGVG